MLSIKTIYANQSKPAQSAPPAPPAQAQPNPIAFPLDRLCLRSNEIGVRPLCSMTNHAVYLQPPSLSDASTLARRKGIEDEINDRKGIIVDHLDDVFYTQAEHKWIVKADLGAPVIKVETGRLGVPILCTEWEFWAVIRRADLERLAYLSDHSPKTHKEYAPYYVLPNHEGPKVE